MKKREWEIIEEKRKENDRSHGWGEAAYHVHKCHFWPGEIAQFENIYLPRTCGWFMGEKKVGCGGMYL